MKRLYVVVRSDLPPGLQMAQACHAVRAFSTGRPVLLFDENLIALNATPAELMGILARVHHEQIPYAPFYEPDLDLQLTAIAISGDGQARRILSTYPLALRDDWIERNLSPSAAA